MKITAEFNSVQELLSFANTFGKAGQVQQCENAKDENITEIKAKEVEKEENQKTDTTVESKTENTETKKGESETQSDDTTSSEEKKADSKEEKEAKVTKEMVRERLGLLVKSGKKNEVKELVAKYGASKVPDLKEEDYAAVYKEAEGLL